MAKEPTNNQDTEGREPNTLLHEDEVFRDGFTQVSNRVLRARNLSAPAKTLYAILLSYSWQADKCFPGYARLCEDMRLSEKIVRKYMHELEGVKLLAQKRRGLGLTNIYILLSLKKATLDTASEAERDTPPDQERDRGNDPKRDTSPDKEYSSKNTQIKNTKSFRKANALKPKREENGQTPARSHRARMTTGKQKGTGEQKGRGVTFSPDKEGTTNKQDVQGSAQQVTPALMIPKSVQENTERGTNGHPSTANQTPTQKRVAKIEAEKQKQKPIVGKPITQEEIDEKRRHGQNASGYTPLSQIPPSHWQELETRAAAHPTNGNGNGHHSGAHNGSGLHYSSSTTHAPDFIDALIEQFSKLLHDEEGNIPQNINRAAKLYRQSGASEDIFITLLHDAYTAAKCKQKIVTLHSDGRPNKMPYFFSVLADKLGVKPNQPT